MKINTKPFVRKKKLISTIIKEMTPGGLFVLIMTIAALFVYTLGYIANLLFGLGCNNTGDIFVAGLFTCGGLGLLVCILNFVFLKFSKLRAIYMSTYLPLTENEVLSAGCNSAAEFLALIEEMTTYHDLLDHIFGEFHEIILTEKDAATAKNILIKLFSDSLDEIINIEQPNSIDIAESAQRIPTNIINIIDLINEQKNKT